ATVGLELERSACARKRLEKLPAMGYSERLAAAERNIRNAEAIDLARDRQRFVARRFIGPRLVGSGFFATGDATRIAAIGQLPGDKKRRAVLLDRTSLRRRGQRWTHWWRVSVLRGSDPRSSTNRPTRAGRFSQS